MTTEDSNPPEFQRPVSHEELQTALEAVALCNAQRAEYVQARDYAITFGKSLPAEVPRESIAAVHASTLARAGLCLPWHDAPEVRDLGQIWVKLEEGSRFVDYLRALPHSRNGGAALMRVQTLADQWVGSVEQGIVIAGRPNPADEEFLAYAPAILEALQAPELPVSPSADLVDLVRYQGVCIREYAQLHYAQVFATPTGAAEELSGAHKVFEGLSLSVGIQELAAYCVRLVSDPLARLRSNDDPRAQELYARAVAGARAHLKLAQSTSEQAGNEQSSALCAVYSELERMLEDDK